MTDKLNPNALPDDDGGRIHIDPKEGECWHVGIVSISDAECQCMDCLRIWPKEPGFVSDWPQHDRG